MQAGVDEKAVYGALIRRGSVLSTGVNPTDGLRFDGGAKVPPRMVLIRHVIAADGRRRSWQWPRRDLRLYVKLSRSTMCS
jgi:hypothetical protein